MTETVLALVPAYGAAALFVAALLSCLGVPTPGSVALLLAGSFVGTGEMSLATALAAGLGGAVAGDQLGYLVGHAGGQRLSAWIAARRSLAEAIAKARSYAERWGGLAVFLTRWLMAPLGPAVNLLSGLTHMNWARFSVAVVLGEIIWTGTYVGLGYAFSSSILAIAGVLGDLTWLLASAAVTVALALRARAILRARHARRTAPASG